MSKYIFLFFFILLTVPGFGQNKKSGEVGVSLGGAYYLGDLNKIPFKNTTLSAGAFYRHIFNYRYSARGTFNYGHLNGSGTNLQNNAEQFSGPFYEFSGTMEFNFRPFVPGDKKFDYAPYVFAGMSMVYYQIGQNMLIPTIPFGVGCKIHLTNIFSLGFTYQMNKTFTDYVDYKYNTLENGRQVSYAGNKDWFSVFGINLAYKLNYRMKCPAFD